MICMFKEEHARTFQIYVLQYDLDPARFLTAPGIAW